MTKIRCVNKIILLFCAIIISPAYSLDMCVENDSVVVVLDPNVGSGNNSYHGNTATFKVMFSYGTLTGVTACLSGSMNLGTGAMYTANNGLLMDNGNIVTGGERNGGHCWCKITHPVNTLWYYRSDNGASSCGPNCPSLCANEIRDSVDARTKLFNTVDRY